jgi:hypothetical protein
MQPRLCLLCRWTLHSMPFKGFKEDLTIIVPRSAVNTPDNISSDVYSHWLMKGIGEPVKSWLLNTFAWIEEGHSAMAMYYGLPAQVLPDGRPLLTLPVLITTLDHRLEFIFCGYHVVTGDNVPSGYACRTYLPQHDWFDSTITAPSTV